MVLGFSGKGKALSCPSADHPSYCIDEIRIQIDSSKGRNLGSLQSDMIKNGMKAERLAYPSNDFTNANHCLLFQLL